MARINLDRVTVTTFGAAKPGELLIMETARKASMIGFKAKDKNGEKFICLTPSPDTQILFPRVTRVPVHGSALRVDDVCRIVPDLSPDSCQVSVHISDSEARGCLFLADDGVVLIGAHVGEQGRIGCALTEVKTGAPHMEMPRDWAAFKRWKIVYDDGTDEPQVLYAHKPAAAT